MARRADTSRDLRLGLYALESGAIDDEQLLSAIRAWTRTADRTLSEIFASRGVLDAESLVRLEERVESDRVGPTPLPARAEGVQPPAPQVRRTEPGPDATVTYDGRTVDGTTGDGGTGTGSTRFQVLGPHARGGLGEVFLAFDRELNRSVALKELQPRRAHDPDAQARFLQEAEVTGRLEHPGIVPVYSLGRHPDGRPYYAMRLIEGETLGVAITRLYRTGAGAPAGEDRELGFRRLLRCVIDTCNAVAYAHSRGVVHRDLKPDNIMLGPFGETLVVDWGVAKSLVERPESASESSAALESSGDPSRTQPGSLVGTPRYMSPEQAEGDLDRVGRASDVYSLGAILYCVLVGHAPFVDRDLAVVLNRVRRGIFPAPRRIRRSVDPRLEAICLKAMAREPAERYASALDLAEALEAWEADLRYRGEQEQALSQMQGSLTRLCLERAHQGFDRDAHAEGMLWLARALENAPPELSRMIRLSLHGWHSGVKLMERVLRHASQVHALVFCPEGRRLATACADRSAMLWDVSTGSPLSAPLAHEGTVRALGFHPDGRSLVTADENGDIRSWDAVTGRTIGDRWRNGASIDGLRFSPDGATLAVTGEPGRAILWEVATGRPVCGVPRSRSRIRAVAFSPDGTFLAAAGADGGLHLLEVATGLPHGEPLIHAADLSDVAFDPTGNRILSTCLDGVARLWDLAERVAVQSVSHQGAVHSVAFRPGGEAFATACEDGTARLWELQTGHPIGEPLGHRERVTCLAFRPDGTILATGSTDGTVRLWCALTGLSIGPPLAHGGAVQSLEFSPDGRRLAAGGGDATVRCWKAPSPVEGDPERISCWIGVTTDLEFDSGDAIRRMDGTTSWERRRRLSELGGAPFK